jgi:hypothetical protein
MDAGSRIEILYLRDWFEIKCIFEGLIVLAHPNLSVWLQTRCYSQQEESHVLHSLWPSPWRPPTNEDYCDANVSFSDSTSRLVTLLDRNK